MTEEFDILYQLVFFTAALALFLLERVRVLQSYPVQPARRWTSNIGLFLIGAMVTAIVMPVSIYSFAAHQPPGLVSHAGLPIAIEFLLTFLLLDFWRYWEHRLFHRVPMLWRVHLVHHSDTQVDVTTSERHHPFELLIATAVMLALIAALGLSAAPVGLYLLVATVVALCSHANLRIPGGLDRRLRWLIVTPAVHAVHHSDLQRQTDSNYGSVLTVWDRIFGTYSDPEGATVQPFGLAYFHRSTDTVLARVLQQPFLYRRNLQYPPRMGTTGESSEADTVAAQRSGLVMTRAGKNALLGGIAGCVLVSVVMWPTWKQLAGLWQNESYQYAWLVLPMVAYLLASRHHLTGSTIDFRPDFTGVPVVIFAAACWGVGALTNIDAVQQFALVLALQGVAMSALGWRSYWKLFPVLALLFLLIPAGDLLQPVLLAVTVKAIALFAALAHLPHDVQGFLVYIGDNRYIVADECSGLAYVTLAIFLGYSFGCLLYRSVVKIAALALFSAFLGVACNIMRVNAIVLIDWMRGTQMDLAAHGNIQWIALFATLMILFYVLSRLKGDAATTATADAAGEPAGGVRKLAPVLAGASALLVTASAIALPVSDAKLPRVSLNVLPLSTSGWRLLTPEATWSVSQRGATQAIRLIFEGHGRDVNVVIVETLSPDAKLSESNLGPPDAKKWRNRQARVEAGCVGDTCVAFVHATWERDRGRETRHAYYTYSVGDYTSNSNLTVRVAYGWRRLTGNGDAPRLIGFVAEGPDLDVNEVAATFQTLQVALKIPPTNIGRAVARD